MTTHLAACDHTPLLTSSPLSGQAVFDGKFGDFESNKSLCPNGRLDRAAFNLSGLSEDVLAQGEDCSDRDQEDIACGECRGNVIIGCS